MSITRGMLVQSPEPEREGKTGVPEENLSGKDENQQETQHTYDSESGNLPRATLVRGGGGQCFYHCAKQTRASVR